MIKKLFIVALFAAFIIPANAQFELKGLVGLNFSSLHNSPDGQNVSGKMGYQFGAGVLIGNKFYVEPGIQFVRQTMDFEISSLDPSNPSTYEISENLVKIPVYLGYHLLGSEDGMFALRIFAGPAM